MIFTTKIFGNYISFEATRENMLNYYLGMLIGYAIVIAIIVGLCCLIF